MESGKVADSGAVHCGTVVAFMPTTRSMRALSTAANVSLVAAKPRASRVQKAKRTIEDIDSLSSSPQTLAKKARVLSPSSVGTHVLPSSETNMLLPAVLSFSFETAKQHLIAADARFEGVFSKLPCRPFEELETVDPFRWVVSQHRYI